MNTRALTLALIIALLAMFMVYTYIEDQESIMKKKYGVETPVVIAKVDINELDLIDESKVTITKVPQNFVQPGHFKSIKEVENTVASVPIIKGEQLTKPRVTYPDSKTGLARQVSIGKRAFAIPVGDSQAVGKLIKPGDRVDVMAQVSYAPGRKDLDTMTTILQDVLVLSTGKSITNSIPLLGVKTPRVIKKMNLSVYENYNIVNLELTPTQAQKLAFLIQAGGNPFLVLRNNNDKERPRVAPTKLFDLLPDQDKAKAKTYFQEKFDNNQGNRGRR